MPNLRRISVNASKCHSCWLLLQSSTSRGHVKSINRHFHPIHCCMGKYLHNIYPILPFWDKISAQFTLFSEKFTRLTRILHDRRSHRSRQISTLEGVPQEYLFLPVLMRMIRMLLIRMMMKRSLLYVLGRPPGLPRTALLGSL